MSKRTGYVRNIFFSILISIVIFLALGFFSIKYLVPIYDLKSQEIYQFLIYLLPVLIGLAFIELGSIIASKEDRNEDNGEDLLPKNSYDAPLFNTISDDPSEKVNPNNLTPINPTATNTYSYTDYLDNEIVTRLKKYDKAEIIKMLDTYELGESINKVVSPFDKELTDKIFSLSKNEAIKALKWIEDGSPLPIENAVVLNNLDNDTIEKIKLLSQREATMALNFINRSTLYANLENIDEANLHALSQLENDLVTKAIEWVYMGCPQPADPRAKVFENLDKDTLLRLEEYNSIQVNVGLDYIDDGAPDVETPNSVVLPNLQPKTVDRLLDFSDDEINKGLDTLEYDFLTKLNEKTLDRLSCYPDEEINQGLDALDYDFLTNLNDDTIDRLNAYDDEKINSALDYIDQGQPKIEESLPFDSEISDAIRHFSLEEAKNAVEYVKTASQFDSQLGDLSNNLEDFLNSELADNKKQGFNFDISIAIFDKENVLSDDVKDILFSKLPPYTYIYDTLNSNKAIIFPYEGKDKAKNYIDSILREEADLLNNEEVKVGYAAQENRDVDAKLLINEAYLN